MDQLNIDFKESIPVAQLGIIPLESSPGTRPESKRVHRFMA